MAKANLLPTLGEGFRLIVREPASVLVWGLITFVAAFLPAMAYWALLGPELIGFYGDMAGAAASDSDEMPMPPGMTGASALVQLLQYVLMPVSGALVYVGIYRAVLRPEEGGFGHVRFGRDEFHVGVVLVVLYVLMIIATIVGVLVFFIPVGIGIAMAAAGGAAAYMAFLPFLFGLLMLVGFAVLYSRIGMALPMTFADGQIRIFEGWSFTKGYAGQLLGMAMIQVAISVGIFIAVALVVIAAFAGSFAAIGLDGVDTAEIQNLFTNPERLLQQFLPVILVVGVIYFVLMFLMQPIMLAPWARAYQLIAADKLGERTEMFT